jgi:outer membrane lipoprotein LolB
MNQCLAVLIRLCWRSMLGCLLLMVSACQTVPSDNAPGASPSDSDIAAREAVLSEMETFSLSGSLGIWTDEESISAKINWQQAPNTLTLKLTGPLGLGEMTLLDDGQAVTLQRGNRLLVTGDSADTVLQDGLGLAASVPLEQIRQWVRGLPGAASTVVRDKQGRLSSLRFKDKQGTGWLARFLGYTRLEQISVPALITASGGPYSVRLRLKNWQLVPTSVVPELRESNKRLAIPSR